MSMWQFSSNVSRLNVFVIGLATISLIVGVKASRAQAPSPTATPAASYLPVTATVQLSAAPTPAGSTNNTSGTTPAAAAQPLAVSSPDLFAPTSLAAQPQPATVTLSYDSTHVGAAVQVAPLDGGMINGTPGAKTVTVATDGTLTFTFLPPGGPGRYHVVVRLAGSEIGLPFDVAAANAPSPTPNGN